MLKYESLSFIYVAVSLIAADMKRVVDTESAGFGTILKFLSASPIANRCDSDWCTLIHQSTVHQFNGLIAMFASLAFSFFRLLLFGLMR